MVITITFPGRTCDSKELYEDLKPFNMNVTDCGTVIYVHSNDITANQIAGALSVCDKYGSYQVEDLHE